MGGGGGDTCTTAEKIDAEKERKTRGKCPEAKQSLDFVPAALGAQGGSQQRGVGGACTEDSTGKVIQGDLSGAKDYNREGDLAKRRAHL